MTDTNYEYVLCAPDVYADILHLRKKISKEKFPNPVQGFLFDLIVRTRFGFFFIDGFFLFVGSLHPNVEKMLEKFIRGKEYQSAKYEEARGVLELRFGIVRLFLFFPESKTKGNEIFVVDQYA